MKILTVFDWKGCEDFGSIRRELESLDIKTKFIMYNEGKNYVVSNSGQETQVSVSSGNTRRFKAPIREVGRDESPFKPLQKGHRHIEKEVKSTVDVIGKYDTEEEKKRKWFAEFEAWKKQQEMKK